jgi:tRNA-specific adenosine deaminase 1
MESKREYADTLASTCLQAFLSLPPSCFPAPRSNGIPQYTVLAGIVLHSLISGNYLCISLATGSKCLPASRLPINGDALHDSHAEILARRGALRWFPEEIGRSASENYQSEWVCRAENRRWSIRDGISPALYVSTLPCERGFTSPTSK